MKGNNKPFYGWVVVGVTFLIGLTQAGVFQNILSIFMKPMIHEFGWNRSMVTGAISIGSLLGGFSSPFMGSYLDKHGPRMIAFWGILILSGGLATLTALSHIWQLYIFFGIGRMISTGLLGLVIAVSVSNWFEEKRGRAMGIAQLGPRAGTAVFPPLVQGMILWFGWRYAWTGLGVIVFLLSAVPTLLFLKRRPEDMGMLPDGKVLEKPDSKSKIITGLEEPVIIADETNPVWERKQVFRTRAFWSLLVVHSIAFFAGGSINFHLYPFLTDHNHSTGFSVAIISVIAVCGAMGSLLMGFLAERIPVKRLLSFVLIGLGSVFLTIFFAVESKILVLGFSIIFGVIRGGILPLLILIWVEFYGRESSGTVIGLGGPFRLTANALGPVFAAVAFDFLGSYQIPFILFALLFITAGIIMLSAQKPALPLKINKSG